MESHPIVIICTVIGTVVGILAFRLASHQSGYAAQANRWLVQALVVVSAGSFLFAGYRWWEGHQEQNLITSRQDLTDFEEAAKCGTIQCFQAYLESHPNGQHVKMARARISSSGSGDRAVTTDTASPARPSTLPRQALLSGRYQDNGDGTVTDMQTNLQWMRCALGQIWQGGTCTSEAASYQWQAALNVAKAVNSRGGYAGYQDWRVPSIEELRSLVYCSSGAPEIWNNTGNSCQGDYSSPTIDSTAFPNTPASSFWSASPYASNAVYAWYVNFYGGGFDGWDGRSDAYHVRLVRAGQ